MFYVSGLFQYPNIAYMIQYPELSILISKFLGQILKQCLDIRTKNLDSEA